MSHEITSDEIARHTAYFLNLLEADFKKTKNPERLSLALAIIHENKIPLPEWIYLPIMGAFEGHKQTPQIKFHEAFKLKKPGLSKAIKRRQMTRHIALLTKQAREIAHLSWEETGELIGHEASILLSEPLYDGEKECLSGLMQNSGQIDPETLRSKLKLLKNGALELEPLDQSHETYRGGFCSVAFDALRAAGVNDGSEWNIAVKLANDPDKLSKFIKIRKDFFTSIRGVGLSDERGLKRKAAKASIVHLLSR